MLIDLFEHTQNKYRHVLALQQKALEEIRHRMSLDLDFDIKRKYGPSEKSKEIANTELESLEHGTLSTSTHTNPR